MAGCFVRFMLAYRQYVACDVDLARNQKILFVLCVAVFAFAVGKTVPFTLHMFAFETTHRSDICRLNAEANNKLIPNRYLM